MPTPLYTDADALKTAIRAALASDTYVLGLTQGGGTFLKATPNICKIEGDGIRGNSKAQPSMTADVKLTGTMKEITADNMQLRACAWTKLSAGV